MTIRLLKVNQVCEITGFGRTTIYRWVKLNKFPKPITIGKNIRWYSADVEAWIISTVEQHRSSED